MEFKVKDGNYLKSSNTTSKMMFKLLISLIPIILFSFYKNGILPYIKGYADIFMMFKPLMMVIISSIVCLFSEYLWYYFTSSKKSIKYLINNSYSIIPGVFLALILPINTSYLILIIGSIFATIIGKMVYGGFGHNIFNPALIGRIFIIASYGGIILNQGGYFNPYEKIDAISSATPLANLSSINYIGSYNEVVGPYGGLINLFLGKIPGTLGEVSKLLIICSFIYLVYNKVIKVRIPISYISTVFVMSMIIGLINGCGLWYPMFHILVGGLLFGAVFMATDPVTSPISINSQIVYGICLGILTIFFRFLTPYPEGVLSSILFMNLFIPIFNNVSIKNCFKNTYHYIIIFIIIGIILSVFIGFKLKNTTTTNNNDEYLKVVDVIIDNDKYTYKVTYRGFTSDNGIEANVIIKNNTLLSIDVINTTDHYYDTHIKNTNYLHEIVQKQNDLDSIDTISGATYTSKYLKDMIKAVFAYHRGNYE